MGDECEREVWMHPWEIVCTTPIGALLQALGLLNASAEDHCHERTKGEGELPMAPVQQRFSPAHEARARMSRRGERATKSATENRGLLSQRQLSWHHRE